MFVPRLQGREELENREHILKTIFVNPIIFIWIYVKVFMTLEEQWK